VCLLQIPACKNSFFATGQVAGAGARDCSTCDNLDRKRVHIVQELMIGCCQKVPLRLDLAISARALDTASRHCWAVASSQKAPPESESVRDPGHVAVISGWENIIQVALCSQVVSFKPSLPISRKIVQSQLHSGCNSHLFNI
jgi:hypothetical protein